MMCLLAISSWLLRAGGKAALELKLAVTTAQFVEITWNIGDFDEQSVLMWIVSYRTA